MSYVVITNLLNVDYTLHIYGVCLLRTRTPELSGATLTGELACQNILYSAVHSQKFLFQTFFPISHLIGCSRSAVYRSHLTPSKSPSWRFRKLSRRSTMTRPWWECTYKQFSKSEGGETIGGGGESEVPERKGFHRRYHRRSGEWPVGECQETRSGPWHFDLNGSWHSPQWSAALKKVGLLSDQNGLLWDEEGALQDNKTFITINVAVSWQS